MIRKLAVSNLYTAWLVALAFFICGFNTDTFAIVHAQYLNFVISLEISIDKKIKSQLTIKFP